MEIEKRLKDARVNAGLTQEQVAGKIMVALAGKIMVALAITYMSQKA